MMHNGFGSGFEHYGNWLCGPGAFFHGPLITLLFWGLVIYLAVKLFGSIFSGEKKSSGIHLDTLKERYARGEITEEEYHHMKTDLS